MQEARSHRLLRFSLAVVWLATAIVSAFERGGQSAQLLEAAGVTGSTMKSLLIWSGSAIDAILGLALLFVPIRATYIASLVMMICMTVAATLLLPELWLHPLGPLTKNLPIAAILWVLVWERR